MILASRYKKPVISFGLGVYAKTINVGESITVWLQTTYNKNEYSISQKGKAPSHKVSDYQQGYTGTVAGTFEIYWEVKNTSGTIIKKSNKLILTVV